MAKPSFELPTGIRYRADRDCLVANCIKPDGKRSQVAIKGDPRDPQTLSAAITKKMEVESGQTTRQDVCEEADATPAKGQGWNIAYAIRYTIKHEWSKQKAPENQIRNAHEARKFFGDKTLLTDISTEDIDRYVEKLERDNLASGTINRKLSALSKLFTMAVKRGKMARKPVMPFQKEGQGRLRYLTDAEEDRITELLLLWGLEDALDVFICLIDTGFRGSELWNFEGDQYNVKTNQLHLWDTKTSSPRTIIATSRVRPILIRRKAIYGRGPLFPKWHNGKIGDIFERLAVNMNLIDDKGFIPYVLRHTCCSRLVQKGIQLVHVKTWMGHKAIQTTLRYSHLAPQDMETCAVALEKEVPIDELEERILNVVSEQLGDTSEDLVKVVKVVLAAMGKAA